MLLEKQSNRFQKGSGCYVCELCGKRTRITDGESRDAALVGICKDCWVIGGWENSHSDEGHRSHPEYRDPECPFCQRDGYFPITKETRKLFKNQTWTWWCNEQNIMK